MSALAPEGRWTIPLLTLQAALREGGRDDPEGGRLRALMGRLSARPGPVARQATE